MTEPAVRERRALGAVPTFAVPEWETRFRVRAGITARSHGPRVMDFRLPNGAEADAPREPWPALLAEIGFRRVAVARQVHHNRMVWHESGDPGPGWFVPDGVDGHATAAAGLLLAVTVADCIPVYLVDPVRRQVALVHAGWRGTAAGILFEAVKLLEVRGSPACDLVMHCGIGICGLCYEVGEEVFRACGGPGPVGDRGLDLRGVLVAQGRTLGIGSISRSQFCSAHDRPLFHSHRASAGADGRMAAYLGLLP
jgi:hypothetical protein